MALLLMYNLSPALQGAVRMLCARLKIRARAVEASEYKEKLGALAGMEEKRNEPFSGEPFADEMLLMAGFAPQTLDALLRGGETGESAYLPFEIQMAEAAAKILSARRGILGELGRRATEKYEILARENGESAEIKIRPNCDAESPAALLKILAEHRAKDIERRATSHGPHRDDFKILVGGRDAKTYASEGQQRSAVIALKLAQFEILRDTLGVRPTVLCDDILGELDTSRRSAFWSCVDADAQIVATSTTDAPTDAARGVWKTITARAGTFE